MTNIETGSNHGNQERKARQLALSHIAVNFGMLQHGINAGASPEMLQSQVEEVRLAVSKRPDGVELLKEAAEEYITKRTILDPKGGISHISRVEKYGKEEAERQISIGIQLVLKPQGRLEDVTTENAAS